MPTYESSIVIGTEAGTVWQVLSDVPNWSQWSPTVTKVVPLDGASMVRGSRFVIYQPNLRPATWKVTEFDAPRRFVWEANSPGLHMVAEHAVAPQAPGASAVHLRFSFGGLLGGIIGRLFRSTTERYLAQEGAALKNSLQSGGE